MLGKTTDVSISSATEASIGSGTGRPWHDAIAQLAYRLYEANGRQDGRDLQDWLLAERMLADDYT